MEGMIKVLLAKFGITPELVQESITQLRHVMTKGERTLDTILANQHALAQQNGMLMAELRAIKERLGDQPEATPQLTNGKDHGEERQHADG